MKLHISTASQRPQALLRKAVVEKASLLPTRVALKAAIVVAVAALVELVALLGEATVAMVEAKEVSGEKRIVYATLVLSRPTGGSILLLSLGCLFGNYRFESSDPIQKQCEKPFDIVFGLPLGQPLEV